MLGAYEWKWDDHFGLPRTTPADNIGKNGADAFRQWAQGYKGDLAGFRAQANQYANLAGGSGRKYAQSRPSRGSLLNPTTDHIV